MHMEICYKRVVSSRIQVINSALMLWTCTADVGSLIVKFDQKRMGGKKQEQQLQRLLVREKYEAMLVKLQAADFAGK